jgi:hypothetical protein
MSSGEQGSQRCSHRNEMVIYGVALLAFSMLLGTHLGDLIGVMIGVQANVGGGYCHVGATNPL